jgi:DNA mismatch endonuclease (patch repair protein)
MLPRFDFEGDDMVDSLTSEERSKRMSLIRSRNTRPEMFVRQSLHSSGLRYRLHGKNLPGRPDLVFASRKLVIFVNGCFWHGHKCKIGHIPKSNSAFWAEKIFRNRSRDARTVRALRRSGWKVCLVWECGLTAHRAPATLQWLRKQIARRDVLGNRKLAV